MWGAIIGAALNALSSSGKKDGGNQNYDFGKPAEGTKTTQPGEQQVSQSQPMVNTGAPAITTKEVN